MSLIDEGKFDNWVWPISHLDDQGSEVNLLVTYQIDHPSLTPSYAQWFITQRESVYWGSYNGAPLVANKSRSYIVDPPSTSPLPLALDPLYYGQQLYGIAGNPSSASVGPCYINANPVVTTEDRVLIKMLSKDDYDAVYSGSYQHSLTSFRALTGPIFSDWFNSTETDIEYYGFYMFVRAGITSIEIDYHVEDKPSGSLEVDNDIQTQISPQPNLSDQSPSEPSIVMTP